MRPRISIIIPLYNVEDYIEYCLKSILNQRFEEYEVILINDGSTDKSRKIIDKYAINDERIKVIHKNNEGASKARNLGIEKAKGEYIAFVDSDDTINNMMYEKMYSIAIHKDADIVACGYKEINYKSNEIYEYINPLDNSLELQGEEIKKKIEELLYFNRILGYSSLCNKLYKSECIKNNKLRINERIKIAEDLCFNI